jgi:hypothetical protein
LIHKPGYNVHYLGRVDVVIDKQMTDQGPQVMMVPCWRLLTNHGVALEAEGAATVV